MQADLTDKTSNLNDRIADVEKELTNRIAEQAEKQTEKLTAHIDATVGKLAVDIKETVGKLEVVDKNLTQRVSSLEVWRWTILGGAIVVGFIISAFFVKMLEAFVEHFGGWMAVFK